VKTDALRPDHAAILEWVRPGCSVLDLGCGSGELLELLVKQRRARAQGVEIDEQAIYQCVARGLSVFHEDIDNGLTGYGEKSFDYVILNESLQQVRRLDDVLAAAGEAVWAAGPLNKGSNLCHGTGGNGYAFLKLYQRTGDANWLQRARAFAMHGIAQTEADAQEYGQMRYSLWTGDPGLAIYLWDCLRGRADFPTLDVFFGAPVA